MRAVVLSSVAGVAVLLAAAPPAGRPADDLVRAGNAAVARADYAAAVDLYAAAAGRARDPGLVAFNTATALYHLGRYADAERHYTRALDDLDAPPARRADALYNRGVCLIRQGGLAKLRTAIDSLERCLRPTPADDRLAADARHNLELAKLLWAEARAKERDRPRPNDPAEDEPPQPRPLPPDLAPYDPFAQDPFGDDPSRRYGGAEPVGGSPTGPNPRPTDQTVGGKGDLSVAADGDRLPDWTPQQLRAYLDRLADRLARDRRGTAVLTAPAERPGVKDW